MRPRVSSRAPLYSAMTSATVRRFASKPNVCGCDVDQPASSPVWRPGEGTYAVVEMEDSRSLQSASQAYSYSYSYGNATGGAAEPYETRVWGGAVFFQVTPGDRATTTTTRRARKDRLSSIDVSRPSRRPLLSQVLWCLMAVAIGVSPFCPVCYLCFLGPPDDR